MNKKKSGDGFVSTGYLTGSLLHRKDYEEPLKEGRRK